MYTCKALNEQKRACIEKMEYSDSESNTGHAPKRIISHSNVYNYNYIKLKNIYTCIHV